MSEEQLEFVKVGFVFSAALTLLCWPIAPDPQRWEVLGAIGVYPLGLGFFFWPAVGYMLAGARSDFGASACLAAVTAYDYWVVEQLTASEAGSPALIERLWVGNRLGLAAVAALYVCGQLAVVLQRCGSGAAGRPPSDAGRCRRPRFPRPGAKVARPAPLGERPYLFQRPQQILVRDLPPPALHPLQLLDHPVAVLP